MIPRYSRPEMTAIWSPETTFRIWFEIEAHAASAMAELGIGPAEAHGHRPVHVSPRPEGHERATVELLRCGGMHRVVGHEGLSLGERDARRGTFGTADDVAIDPHPPSLPH